MSSKKEEIEEYSFKSYFIPFTTFKAIHWIAIIGFIVYFNILFNGFVGDDFGQIVNNQLIQSLTNFPQYFITSTFQIGNNITGIYYKPLLTTLYALLFSLFGSTPFFYHFFQLLLFIANGILVFLLFNKFTYRVLSFMFAVVFLLHPMNQDSAAYISNLQEVLFVFFGLSALLISMSVKYGHKTNLVLTLLILSILSKETGLAFFFIHLTYIAFFRKEKLKLIATYSIIIIISYIVLHTIIVGIHFTAANEYQISMLPLELRLINIPQIIIFYLYSYIVPFNLVVNYDWVVTKINYSQFVLPMFGLIIFFAILIVFGIKLKKINQDDFRKFFFFFIWFLTGLAFHLQIIPLDGTVAPRWFYLTQIGLLGMIAILFLRLSNNEWINRSINIFLFIIIIIFSFHTISRNTHFKNNVTLMCHDASASPDNFALQTSCGASLFGENKIEESIEHLEKSVRLAPHASTNWSALGTALGKLAEEKKDRKLLKEAEAAIKTAIKNDKSNDVTNYNNLGYLYTYYNNTDTAKSFLNSARSKFPNEYKLWLYTAIVEYKLGNKEESLNAIHHAYRINPNDMDARRIQNDLLNNIPLDIFHSEF